jgi:hypothetical protein
MNMVAGGIMYGVSTDLFTRKRLIEIEHRLGDPDITRETLATLEALAPDEVNKPPLLHWLHEGLIAADRRVEIRTALRCLARIIRPRSYLEIGTRRGWSIAQVVSEAPDVRAYSIDLWVANYGGTLNPGPEFVRAELSRIVPTYRGELTFLTGNSHDLLPVFLEGAWAEDSPANNFTLIRHSEGRPRLFDLVTVDGDHSAVGTWWDLLDVMPHIALGGAMVIDDLVDTSDEVNGARPSSCFAHRRAPLTDFRPSLLDVWRRIRRIFGNFTYLEYLDARPPVGIAVRMH